MPLPLANRQGSIRPTSTSNKVTLRALLDMDAVIQPLDPQTLQTATSMPHRLAQTKSVRSGRFFFAKFDESPSMLNRAKRLRFGSMTSSSSFESCKKEPFHRIRCQANASVNTYSQVFSNAIMTADPDKIIAVPRQSLGKPANSTRDRVCNPLADPSR